MRPESARIAIRGIQPKGVAEDGEGTLPISKTIQSMFPYYTEYTRLGGSRRPHPLKPEELTLRDLESAALDARIHAGQIYQDVFAEYSAMADLNRSLQPAWVEEAREAARRHQAMVVSDLEVKVAQAPETASDEFLYQDKAEAERELAAARQMLEKIPPVLAEEDLRQRVWNPLPYQRYRGADKE